MIIIFFSGNLQEYFENSFTLFNEWIKEWLPCSYCNNLLRMKPHARYERNPIIDGERIFIYIYRVICSYCGKTHALIPSILVPYKQYSAQEIEEIIIQKLEDVKARNLGYTSASENSIRNWLIWAYEKSGAWLSILRRRVLDITGVMRINSKNFWDEILKLLRKLDDNIPRVLSAVFCFT